MRLSVDHKPLDIAERRRIALQGGFVSEKGRVMGELMVSRAIGDCEMAPYVSQQPSIHTSTITDNDEFIVIACDGLYDVLSDEEVINIVKAHPKEKASIVLREYAYLLGSADNISITVIFFKV